MKATQGENEFSEMSGARIVVPEEEKITTGQRFAQITDIMFRVIMVLGFGVCLSQMFKIWQDKSQEFSSQFDF